jgi:hypothetical protein
VGLAYVFESAVREHLATGRLVRVLEAYCPPFPGLFLYYPSRVQLAPKLRALIDFLRSARAGAAPADAPADRGRRAATGGAGARQRGEKDMTRGRGRA